MDLMLHINLPRPVVQIAHQHKILSIGSCFTEHIGTALQNLKFNVLQNPNGILFDPASVCASLHSYVQPQLYTAQDLFELNELWHSWRHHSRFSGTDKEVVLQGMNAAQIQAHQALKEADWVIVTLGSSFNYRLRETGLFNEVRTVANCHRAPAQWFEKRLMPIDEIVTSFDALFERLLAFNSKLRFIFTISPVRHIRDGVIENNRSKARLLEAVHQLVGHHDNLFYFPSYELVIDVLRDYRFYAEDLVHPNYLATDYVLEHFINTFVTEESQAAIKELKKINIARRHRSSHPQTQAHKRFMHSCLEKVKSLQQQYPYLNLEEEINYFSENSID